MFILAGMNAKVIKSANIALRLLIMVFTVWFVYDRVFQEDGLRGLEEILSDWHNNTQKITTLTILLLLMVLNHFLEAIKWKLLIDKLEKISLWKAFSAVLSGVSVSMFMPNRSGDYLGRVFILDHTNPVRAILVTIIGSFAQLLTTFLAGVSALLFFLPAAFPEVFGENRWMFGLMVFAAGSAIVLSVVIYLNISFFGNLPAFWFGKRFSRISHFTSVFSDYSRNELIKVLLISGGRYLVFSLQFYLLLLFAGLQPDYFSALMLIAITYLLLAFIPSLAITELGTRGSVSVWLFGLYYTGAGNWGPEENLSVLMSSTLLWVINLALPALLGAFFVFRLKFIRRSNGN
jgi:hypothetical protein